MVRDVPYKEERKVLCGRRTVKQHIGVKVLSSSSETQYIIHRQKRDQVLYAPDTHTHCWCIVERQSKGNFTSVMYNRTAWKQTMHSACWQRLYYLGLKFTPPTVRLTQNSTAIILDHKPPSTSPGNNILLNCLLTLWPSTHHHHHHHNF